MQDSVGDIELFAAIVEAGGISAAAIALDSSPPVISRRLAMLEARLGIRLAERSARRFRLTEEGSLYYERGRAILSGLREMEAEVAARGTAAHGLLKVGAPMELGRNRIASLLASFCQLHPGLRAHLVLSDAGFEIGQDGLDVALRFGLPEDQSLISRKLATVRRIVCGSPAYFADRGVPGKPEDLTGHECLRQSSSRAGRSFARRLAHSADGRESRDSVSRRRKIPAFAAVPAYDLGAIDALACVDGKTSA